MDAIKDMSIQIWLNFFNTYLYEQGLITEVERNKMANKIINIQNPDIKVNIADNKLKKISKLI